MSAPDPLTIAREPEPAFCAHMRVRYEPIHNDNGTMSECWRCDSCPHELVVVPRAYAATVHAENEALRAKLARYEDALTMRQRRVAHPDGSWTFEIDTERIGALWDRLDAAAAREETK